MKRPKVIVRCVADRYHSPSERIIEVSGQDGKAGCLISLFNDENGRLSISVYRAERCAVGHAPDNTFEDTEGH